MKLEFTIPGIPVPKARARQGKGRRWYTPKRTSQYEATVRDIVAIGLKEKFRGSNRLGKPLLPIWGLEFPVQISTFFYFPRRTAFLKAILPKASPSYPSRHYGDVENLVKTLLDAMNGLVYEDDSQVVRIEASKLWDDGKGPRTEVTIFA